MENRKDLILNSAAYFFMKKGYDGTTVADIAEMSEIASGTIFKYYRSKKEILDKVIETLIIKAQEPATKYNMEMCSFKDAVDNFIDGVSQTMKRLNSFNKKGDIGSNNYMSFLLYASHQNEEVKLILTNQIRALNDFGVKILKNAMTVNEIRDDIDATFLAKAMVNIYYGISYIAAIGNGLNVEIPMEKWFVNLPRVGNVGSASIYLALEELFHSGMLKKGKKIFLFIPESARFSYVSALLTVV